MFSKNKFILLILLSIIAFAIKYIFFNYPISSGKRVGNLTKLSHKGKILKTWEGTLNEGYGVKLTTYFSISNEKLAEELYAHEGREVTVYYEEYFVGWPRDTKYDVIRWEPQHLATQVAPVQPHVDAATKLLYIMSWAARLLRAARSSLSRAALSGCPSRTR